MKRRAWLLVALTLLAGAVAVAPAAAQSVMVWGDNLPSNLDPHALYDVPSSFVQLNVYDNLYRYEGNPPQLKPWLAESYTASKDGKTWEFKLKKGLTFANGDPLAAADVVYSFQRIVGMKKAAAGPFNAAKVASITAPDAQTVKFVLEQPYAPFLSSIPVLTVVNKKQIDPNVKGDDLGFGWL